MTFFGETTYLGRLLSSGGVGSQPALVMYSIPQDPSLHSSCFMQCCHNDHTSFEKKNVCLAKFCFSFRLVLFVYFLVMLQID